MLARRTPTCNKPDQSVASGGAMSGMLSCCDDDLLPHCDNCAQRRHTLQFLKKLWLVSGARLRAHVRPLGSAEAFERARFSKINARCRRRWRCRRRHGCPVSVLITPLRCTRSHSKELSELLGVVCTHKHTRPQVNTHSCRREAYVLRC
jgi:hypothetical protein